MGATQVRGAVAGAAGLVGIVLLLVVLYVLFGSGSRLLIDIARAH